MNKDLKNLGGTMTLLKFEKQLIETATKTKTLKKTIEIIPICQWNPYNGEQELVSKCN